MEEVDVFLDAVRDTFLGVRHPPLAAEEIRAKRFATTCLRQGYDEEEVDAFLEDVEARLRVRCAECGAEPAEAVQVCARCEAPVVHQPSMAAGGAAEALQVQCLECGEESKAVQVCARCRAPVADQRSMAVRAAAEAHKNSDALLDAPHEPVGQSAGRGSWRLALVVAGVGLVMLVAVIVINARTSSSRSSRS